MPMSGATGQEREHSGLARKLTTILAICQRMNSELDLGDLDTLLDLIASEAADLMDAERASIFLLDEERHELWSKVALGADEILRCDASQGIVGAALAGEVVSVADAYQDARFNPSLDGQTGYRTRTLLAAPLAMADGRRVGVFEVLNKRSGRFTDEDEEILTALAAQAATAIQTAQSFGQLLRDQAALELENIRLRREVDTKYSQVRILGNSPAIEKVRELIERIRDSSAGVLITGESGTGKELAAKAIHYSSLRARRPFVAVNCAALPESLLEAELFGIEHGVATGVHARMGYFQAAGSGTLFLDEIGDLSLTAQAKILRVLQERCLERVGGRTTVRIDARVLSATNKDLQSEVKKGTFREDLYYRLRVVHFRMPSLREIRQDIPLLAAYFLSEASKQSARTGLQISPGLLQRMIEAPWPGNVRQLQNEIQRMVACANRLILVEEDFSGDVPGAGEPGSLLGWGVTGAQRHTSDRQTLAAAVEAVERQMIIDALRTTGNNQMKTAKLLGLSRQGLINKVKRLEIDLAGSGAS